jgi:phytoene dehydrogenase-like protein
LVSLDILSPAFMKRMDQFKSVSGTFRINVALSELPNFSCLLGTVQPGHHTAGIIMAPSVSYMELAYLDAVDYGWSNKPMVAKKNIVITTSAV